MSYYIGIVGRIIKNHQYTAECIKIGIEKALMSKNLYEDIDFDDNIYIIIQDIHAEFENLVIKTLQKEYKIISLSIEKHTNIKERNFYQLYDRVSYSSNDIVKMLQKNCDMLIHIGNIMNNSKFKRIETLIEVK